jgi:hypothetical protein
MPTTSLPASRPARRVRVGVFQHWASIGTADGWSCHARGSSRNAAIRNAVLSYRPHGYDSPVVWASAWTRTVDSSGAAHGSTAQDVTPRAQEMAPMGY